MMDERADVRRRAVTAIADQALALRRRFLKLRHRTAEGWRAVGQALTLAGNAIGYDEHAELARRLHELALEAHVEANKMETR